MLGVPIVCSFRFAKCCFCNLEPAENQSHAGESPYTCLCSLLQLKPERSASADLFRMKTVLLKGLAVCFLRNQCKDIYAEASFLIFAFCFVDRGVRVAFVGCVRCLPDFCQRLCPAWERVPVHWVTDTAIACGIQEFRVKIPLKLHLLGVVGRACMEHKACFPGQPKVDSYFSAKPRGFTNSSVGSYQTLPNKYYRNQVLLKWENHCFLCSHSIFFRKTIALDA